MSNTATFQLEAGDLVMVLRMNSVFIRKSTGVGSFSTMGRQLFADLREKERTRIRDAACSQGTSLENQTEAAHREIKSILAERGVLYS